MNKERICTVYIAPDETILTTQEIQTGLQGPKIEDRVKALKSLVIQIINDDSFSPMIMFVITSLVPIQGESHLLKKILLFYWEVIEKIGANGQLKEEMILVCNSLRNDLLHPNEYIRGRTLKLVSRIKYKGILEPLQSAIVENVKHKHIYVRRNAVVCLYEIFLSFGDDIISDMDEMMEVLLMSESDLSTKRNAFLLLFHTNQQKALDYLNDTLIDHEDTSDFGDIMQLAVLELFRKVCKIDPSQKPKLLRSILHFTKSKSPSVLYECANTLCAVSPSITCFKAAVGIYMQLIQQQTDNNVKLVVLDRLEHVKNVNPKVLEDQILELTVLLSQQSIDIRRKVLVILQSLVKVEAVQPIVHAITKELQKIQNDYSEGANEFRQSLLQTALQMVSTFNQCHEAFAQMLIESVVFLNKIDDQTAASAGQIMTILMQQGSPATQQKIIKAFLLRFYDISHLQIFKCALTVFNKFCSGSEEAIQAFNEIKKAIGSLPIEAPKNKQATQEGDEPKEKKTKVKTIILPDGTYGTQIVEESGGKLNEFEQDSKLREFLMSNSFIASSLSRTLLKLLLSIPQELYNKFASQALMIYCALLRYFQSNLNKIDQETVEKLSQAIRIVTSKGNIYESIKTYLDQNEEKYQPNVVQVNEIVKANDDDTIVKQPDDPIQIRQLKKKQYGFTDIDFADEEVTEDLFSKRKEEQSFVSRLNHIVQLTGYSDPIYSEAFVNIHKFDIVFEVLLINRSPKMVQNVQVEFRTSGDSKVIEKAQGVVLQPNQSTKVRTSIKFSSADLGVINGAIHYENNAGVEQAYLVTKEINVELLDFIYPASTDIFTFRKCWAKYEWENRISINTNFQDLDKYLAHIEKSLKMQRVQNDKSEGENCLIVCANLYAKTKLGKHYYINIWIDDDFLVNISAEVTDNKINGFIRIRSKVKGFVVNLGEKVKQLQNRIE